MKIIHNGKELLSGDETTVKVIFNNLSGLNFSPEHWPSWRQQSYSEYLADMSRVLKVSFRGGDPITLETMRGTVMKRSAIATHAAAVQI